MILGTGISRYFGGMLLYSFLSVEANALVNVTALELARKDKILDGNESSRSPQTWFSKLANVTGEICTLKKHYSCCLVPSQKSNVSGLKLKALKAEKQITECLQSLQLCYRENECVIESKISVPGCDFLAVCCHLRVEEASSASSLNCTRIHCILSLEMVLESITGVGRHDSEDVRRQVSKIKQSRFNVTKISCQRRCEMSQLQHLQTINQSCWQPMPKKSNLLNHECCYNISEYCVVLTNSKNETVLGAAQTRLDALMSTNRARDVKAYISRSIISLVVCVFMVIAVFFSVMTYNLWSSRKRYQDSLRSQNAKYA